MVFLEIPLSAKQAGFHLEGHILTILYYCKFGEVQFYSWTVSWACFLGIFPSNIHCYNTNHKLIRWGLVTHDSTDGYSKMILYLQCCTNNRAATVYQAFVGAAGAHNLPSHVHSDQGRGNILVAQYMIEIYNLHYNVLKYWISTKLNICGLFIPH